MSASLVSDLVCRYTNAGRPKIPVWNASNLRVCPVALGVEQRDELKLTPCNSGLRIGLSATFLATNKKSDGRPECDSQQNDGEFHGVVERPPASRSRAADFAKAGLVVEFLKAFDEIGCANFGIPIRH